MRVRPGLLAAYLLGGTLACLESLWPELVLGRGAASAVLWLVALFLLSYPRRQAGEGPAFGGALRELGWLAPPLGLALGLDVARGLEPLRAAGVTLGFAGLCLAWSTLGASAARDEPRRARYREAWFLCVPLLSALALALTYVPRGPEDGGGARLFVLSPLVLAQRAALPGGLEARTAFEFAVAFAGVALVALHARGAARGGRP